MATMTPNIEVICVGNELLIGKTLNTNSQWLAKRATAIGIAVKRVTVVADEVPEIASAVREAIQRKPQFIITTGGLGPTFDDKTLGGIAEALNCKLEVNLKAKQMIKEKYEAYARERKIGRIELTKARIKMATIPEKSEPIRNPVGTAPAVQADLNGTILIALPGVPTEMKAIFEETITPLFKQVTDGNTFHEKSIYADNIMESTLAPLIDSVIQDNPTIYVKSHPKGEENRPHMEIHFSIKSEETKRPEEKLRKAIAQLSKLIEKNKGKIVNSY